MKYWITCAAMTVFAATALADRSSHESAAADLLKASQAEKLTEQMLGQIDGLMDQSFASAGLPAEAKPEWNSVKESMMDWMGEFLSWKELEPMYVEIYTAVFTEEELNELTAFYRSPLGRKMVEKMPALTQKSMEVTMRRMNEKMPELQTRMEEKIVELQKKYSEESSG